MDNVVKQLNDVKDRLDVLESGGTELPEDDNEIHLPKTQGRNKK